MNQRTIIFVDDETDSLRQWMSILSKQGYNVIGLTHGMDWNKALDEQLAEPHNIIAVIEDDAIFHAQDKGAKLIQTIQEYGIPIVALYGYFYPPEWAEPTNSIRIGENPSVLIGHLEIM